MDSLIQKFSIQSLSEFKTEDTHVLVARTGSGPIAIALDPATIAILKEIGIQILEGLAVKALSKMLGLDKGDDLRVLIRLFVEEVSQAVRSALDEDEVRRQTANLEAVYELLREYSRSPSSNLDSFSAAKTQSIVAIKQIESLLPLGIRAYQLGVLTRVAILQEQALKSKQQGDIESLQALALNGANKLTDALNTLIAQVISSVGGVIAADERSTGNPYHDGDVGFYWVATYIKDNQKAYANGATRDEAINNANIKIDRERASRLKSFQSEIGILAADGISQLNQLSKWQLA